MGLPVINDKIYTIFFKIFETPKKSTIFDTCKKRKFWGGQPKPAILTILGLLNLPGIYGDLYFGTCEKFFVEKIRKFFFQKKIFHEKNYQGCIFSKKVSVVGIVEFDSASIPPGPGVNESMRDQQKTARTFFW